MKAITGVLVVLLAALPGLAQQTAPEKSKAQATDYYPLKVGTKWHYQVDAGNGETGKGDKKLIVNQIAKIETIDGQQLARLETVVDGKVEATEHLSTNDHGVFRNRYNNVPVSPPFCLLKYPIKEGDSWETATKIGDQQVTMIGRDGKSEDVQVPAGKYEAVTALVQMTVNGTKISTNYWFAANVGVVKQTLDIAGRTIVMELTKFEEGK